MGEHVGGAEATLDGLGHHRLDLVLVGESSGGVDDGSGDGRDGEIATEMGARQVPGSFNVDESRRGDSPIVGYQDVHVPWRGQSLQTVAAKCPEASQARTFAPVEQRALDPLFIGGFSTVEQHDPGQQPLPRSAGTASARDGPFRHAGGFELRHAKDSRAIGQKGTVRPVSSVHLTTMDLGTDKSARKGA
ncbi:hypothetical protein [Amycolatopsis sp. NPDC049868]|uniref:hypothetical protein n=1 Tax=Amycolatopsis sp. NPDC049868 TaxID=3363934 RepID=UPI0037A8A028